MLTEHTSDFKVNAQALEYKESGSQCLSRFWSPQTREFLTQKHSFPITSASHKKAFQEADSGSVVKSIGCYYRGFRFDPSTYMTTQDSFGDLAPSSGFCGHQAHTLCKRPASEASQVLVLKHVPPLPRSPFAAVVCCFVFSEEYVFSKQEI